MKQIIGDRLLQSEDTTPLPADISTVITSAFHQAGFLAIDITHHISVGIADKEFACLYLAEDGKLWVKALAQRWWLLSLLGDPDQRYEKFWEVVDALETPFEMIQGTVGEAKHRYLH